MSEQPSAALIIEKLPYPAPKDIEIGGDIGKLTVPVPPPRGTPMPGNAVRRTDKRLDAAVKHLGYESLDAGDQPGLRTDQEIVDEAQARLRAAHILPDEQLSSRHRAHLNLARAVANRVSGPRPSVHAAAIPPASDRVRTAGMYGTSSQSIYLSLEQLESARDTIDTLIHELGHHKQYLQRNEATDLTDSHKRAMTGIAADVVRDVQDGRFNGVLGDVVW